MEEDLSEDEEQDGCNRTLVAMRPHQNRTDLKMYSWMQMVMLRCQKVLKQNGKRTACNIRAQTL